MFDKLKSFFIIEDENEKAAAKGQEALQKEQKSQATTDEPKVTAHDITIDVNNTTPPPDGKPDSKFVDKLLGAVEKNNMDGFDYLEFKSSLQSLANVNMDKTTRYKSALAMAETMGASPEKLINSANHYLAILNQEKSKFQEALKGQKAKQITGKEQAINKLAETIQKKKERIAQLQQEIEESTNKMEEMKAGINKSVAKVQTTSDKFHYAYNIVTGQILNDIENMKNFLK